MSCCRSSCTRTGLPSAPRSIIPFAMAVSLGLKAPKDLELVTEAASEHSSDSLAIIWLVCPFCVDSPSTSSSNKQAAAGKSCRDKRPLARTATGLQSRAEKSRLMTRSVAPSRSAQSSSKFILQARQASAAQSSIETNFK